ncbi:protein BCP1, partial [Phenoliferia sp. Uapishka_3]
MAYLLSKSSSSPELQSSLKFLFEADSTPSSSTSSKPTHIGLVVSERLVNMPAQVVPPMYKMLAEELQWAKDDSEPYHFSHLLFLSRVFLASSDEFDEDPNAALNAVVAGAGKKGGKKGGKKAKTGEHESGGKRAEAQVWPYHAEDDFVEKVQFLLFSFYLF